VVESPFEFSAVFADGIGVVSSVPPQAKRREARKKKGMVRMARRPSNAGANAGFTVEATLSPRSATLRSGVPIARA
jgi:hypothetical protein